MSRYFFSKSDSLLFKNIIFENINFRGSIFSGIDFDNTQFIRCKFQGSSQYDSYINFAGLPRFTYKRFTPTIFNHCNFISSEIIDSRYDGSIFNNCQFSEVTMEGEMMRYSSLINCNFQNGIPSFLKNDYLENHSFDTIDSAIETLSLKSKELKQKCLTLYEKDIDLFEYNLPSHYPKAALDKSDQPYISMRLYDDNNFRELPQFVEEMTNIYGQSRANFIRAIYLDLDKSEIYKSQADKLKNMNGLDVLVE